MRMKKTFISLFIFCFIIHMNLQVFALQGTEIVVGETYGSYVVDSMSTSGVEPGVYSFYAEKGNDGYVKLYKDGIYVETLNYEWITTVTSKTAYTFNFSNGISIAVRKAGTGSINLYNMPSSTFDNSHLISIPGN